MRTLGGTEELQKQSIEKAFSYCAKMVESSCHFGCSAYYCFLPVYKLVTIDEGEREGGVWCGGRQ